MMHYFTITVRGAVVVLCAVATLALAADLSPVVVRLTDRPPQPLLPALPLPSAPEAVAPEVPTSTWLWQHGWERV